MAEFPGYIPGFDDPDDLFEAAAPAVLASPVVGQGATAVPRRALAPPPASHETLAPPPASHEHRFLLGSLGVALYFGGGATIIVALVMIFSPPTLSGAESAISSFASSIGAMLRDIGSLLGIK